jgi:hypothetical protein
MGRDMLVREGVPNTYAAWLVLVLVGITTILVWAAVRDVAAPAPGPVVMMRSGEGPEGYVVWPIAGGPLGTQNAYLEITNAEGTQRFPLAELAGEQWNSGEAICVRGPDCLIEEGPFTLRIVASGQTLYQSSRA